MFTQLVRGIGRLLVLSCIFSVSFGVLEAGSTTKNVTSLDERICLARDSFEDIYYELVKQGFFDAYYNNNLVLRTKIDEKFVQEGEIVLYLIDWLDKRNDRDSRYLLKKLSKYLYLEFYQLLCGVDAQKNQNSALLRMLKDIYKCKNATPFGVVAPFRAVLSKMICLIFMINSTNQFYEKKREAMAYTLHKIENQFLQVNASLFEKKLPDESIKNFIQALQTYITREPLVKQSMVKSVIVTFIVIACLAGAGVVVWQYVLPNWNYIEQWMGEVRDNVFKPIGEGMGDGLKRSLLEDPVLLEQLGHRIVHGMAVSDGQPNPDLDILSQKLGNGMIRGMARDSGGQPNPDTDVLAQRLGNGIIAGIAHDNGGQPNPDLALIKDQILPHPIDAAGRGIGSFCGGIWNRLPSLRRRGAAPVPVPVAGAGH